MGEAVSITRRKGSSAVAASQGRTAATEEQAKSTTSTSPARAGRGFSRVPTHTIGVAAERRLYQRAALRLPLEIKRVAGALPAGTNGHSLRLLRTQDISSSGVYFLCPAPLEPGTPVELEICLVHRPFGRGTVRMTTEAHVVRSTPPDSSGLHGIAATFDDIRFSRDEA